MLEHLGSVFSRACGVVRDLLCRGSRAAAGLAIVALSAAGAFADEPSGGSGFDVPDTLSADVFQSFALSALATWAGYFIAIFPIVLTLGLVGMVAAWIARLCWARRVT